MAKYPWTEAQKQNIRNSYSTMPINAMARVFGIDPGVISRFMKSENLTVSKAQIEIWRRQNLTGRTTSTPEIDVILREEYLTVNVNQLAIKVGRSETLVKCRLRQLGLEIPQEIRDYRKTIGQRIKGDIPFNKGKKQVEYMTPEAIERTKVTRFKKGQCPHNTYGNDGAISIRRDNTGRPYKFIRVSVGKWELLHRYLWMQANGAVPDGRIVVFKDGNTMNCDVSNLELITLKENMSRNTLHQYPESLKKIIKLNNKLKKTIHDSSRKKASADAQ